MKTLEGVGLCFSERPGCPLYSVEVRLDYTLSHAHLLHWIGNPSVNNYNIQNHSIFGGELKAQVTREIMCYEM